MSTALKVGGDIDAACTRCKMNLGHTVLAMVGGRARRVRCNTCQGEHNFKAPVTPAKKAASAARAKAARGKADVTSWEARLVGKDVARARRYSLKERFEMNEIIQHATFGVGIITEVRGDKIAVSFNLGEKTLVHGKL